MTVNERINFKLFHLLELSFLMVSEYFLKEKKFELIIDLTNHSYLISLHVFFYLQVR